VRPKRRLRPKVLAAALAITILVIGWGYLVWVAIDFGGDARDGNSRAWTFLAVSALGAVACLFAGLMVTARLFRLLGATSDPTPHPGGETTAFTPPPVSPAGADGNTVLGPGGSPIPERRGRAADSPRSGQGGTQGGAHRHRAG